MERMTMDNRCAVPITSLFPPSGQMVSGLGTEKFNLEQPIEKALRGAMILLHLQIPRDQHQGTGHLR